jgi:maltose O-acetyltransferase
LDQLTPEPAAAKAAPWVALPARLLGALRSELGVGSVPWRYLAVNSLVALLPSFALYRTRAFLYRLAGFDVGKGAVLHGRLTLIGCGNIYRNLHIGAGCRINTPCLIGLMDEVTLGSQVVIGYGVTITTAAHEMDCPDCRAGQVYGKPVRIGNGAWVAANSTILPGVTIGPGAIVGAGSVVTRDVPAHTLVAGVPARPIRMLGSGVSLASGRPTQPGDSSTCLVSRLRE